MKLEDFKELWEAATAPDPDFNREQLRALLRNKGQGTLGKIRRNILAEIVFLAISAVAVLVWFAFRSLPVHWGEWLMFIALFPGNALLYWYKIRAFIQRSDLSEDLAHSLEQYIQRFDRYLTTYKITMTYLVPVLSLIGIMYGFTLARAEDGKGLDDVPPAIWALLGAVTVAYTFLAMWFARWYARKLYGQHIDTLRGFLAELTESDRP